MAGIRNCRGCWCLLSVTSIFVHSTQERMSELKRRNEVLEPLRYKDGLYWPPQEHAIMTVADGEMENFMRVASRTDDSVIFLDNETVVGEGRQVRGDYGRRV